MRLTEEQISRYREDGHLTVPGIFTDEEIETALDDVAQWTDEFIAALDDEKRAWYLERSGDIVDGRPVLRKLDDPVHFRPVFRELAAKPELVDLVEQVIGPGLRVYFSQVFFKPPKVGGPKPVHQDNYYFGPSDQEGMVTVWVALDEATVENGCLFYGKGTNRGPIYPHVAPPDEPFNLQIPEEEAAKHPMTPAPVPRGGVSLHHGNTFHRSSDNKSDRWRRACAIHYVNAGTDFANPALPYDRSKIVQIS